MPGTIVHARSGTVARRKGSTKLLLVLSTLMAFGAISTDMYLPALPALTQSLNASAARIQQTLSLFLVGFALAQLFWGPIGDRFGRRWPVMAGILLFLVGSAGCAMAGTAGQMIFWRILQAVGACAGPVLARAMVRDLYARDRAAQMLSILMLVMGVAPLLAPILGGQVLVWWSWRGIFWVQLVFGLVALLGTLGIRETLRPEMRSSVGLLDALLGYVQLLGNRRFLGYGLAGGFFYGGIYTYLAGSPFAYIDFHHVPATAYGLLFAVNIAGMMSANLINSRLIARVGMDALFRAGLTACAVSGVVLAVNAHFGLFGVAGLAVPLFVYISMLGLVVANSVAGAMAAFPHKAGAASALLGTMHYGIGALISASLGLFEDGTPGPMGALIGVVGIAGLATSLLLHRGPREAA